MYAEIFIFRNLYQTKTTTSFKGQVSNQKILSRRHMKQADEDSMWPEAYFINETWYYYQANSSVIIVQSFLV